VSSAALTCLACEHENRPGEEACAACGSSLSLTLCPGCEAVNSRAAQNCYQCGAALGESPAAAPPPIVWRDLPLPPAPPPPASRAQWPWLLVALSIAIAAASAAHYYLEPATSTSVRGLIKASPVGDPAVVGSTPPPVMGEPADE
jgi:hypothetical protein